MLNTTFTIISIFNVLLTTAGIMGAILAWRSGFNKAANAVQERVINALESEITSLRQRLDDMKDENVRLRLIIETICAALKSRGLAVTIDGDMVSIHDEHGSTTTITHIQEREDGL